MRAYVLTSPAAWASLLTARNRSHAKLLHMELPELRRDHEIKRWPRSRSRDKIAVGARDLLIDPVGPRRLSGSRSSGGWECRASAPRHIPWSPDAAIS